MSISWHREALPNVFEALHSGEHGLSAEEAKKRLLESGENTLPASKPDSIARIFLRQFQSPLIYILLGASALVFSLGEVADGSIILAVLVFNAIAGSIQEGKAQNTLRALRNFVETNATVMRDGKEIIIPDKEVVPGDVIVVQEGEKIPADARLVSVSNLKIDEASLTGESEPVEKAIKVIEKENAQPSDERNMIFRGTNALSGSGRAVVVSTGLSTVIGGIAKEISSIDSEIPLKANIRYLSRAIIAAVAGIGAVILALGIFQGQALSTMFLTIVSLSVSIIPEGLPIVMTLVLATGVWRMSKHNVLVKKLQAVEALGQARVVAVDKTGTITKNELVIRRVWTLGKMFEIGGVGYEPKGEVKLDGATVDAANHEELLFMGKIASFCASARVSYSESEGRWRVSGDPTEAAMLVFGEKVGFKKDDLLRESPFLSEMPFDYKLKYHATVHKVAGKNLLTVIGAPEAVFAACKKIRHAGGDRVITEKDREEFESVLAGLSSRGLRVVGVATDEDARESVSATDVKDLVFLGFWGMQDALRSEVAEAMSRAVTAGMRVVMITGDHKLTAKAIATEAGIFHPGDEVLTGEEIDSMDDQALSAKLSLVSVFARVTPEHKLRIINAYKKRGEIIAMTGDGVNDAPSLVAADLGVAMGKIGTEVSKEAADIVLLDDNFGSIILAVEEGRSIYKTIKKVLLYLFSTSLGEVLVIGGALFVGLPLPILAAQIIWLNFVTDGFLTVALAMEPKEKGLLAGTFEHPKKYIIDRLVVRRMILMGLTMMVGTLWLFRGTYEEDLALGWTISLTVLAVFQWFNAWNCRSESESVFFSNPFKNMYLLGATILVVLLQFAAIYAPFMQKVLRTVPLTASQWGTVLLIAASIILVEEIRKFFYRRSIKRS